jgi:hypothetical protein
MSTCIDCYGTTSIDPCGTTGCISTNYGKCITYSGADLFCATGAVKTFSVTGVAVNPTVLTEYTVSPTGGAGSSLSVKVTRTPGSTTYTVTLVSAGSGYAINDVVTVAGASLGGTTPTNNLSLVITALVPLISSVNTIDEVIANINARLCTLTSVGLNYSGFNYGCLRVGGNLNSIGTSITTAQQFAESTSAALCSLNTRTLALETPTFVAACVSGITSGTSTLSQILTAYGTKICSINTSIDMTGVTNNPCITYAFTTKPSTTVVSDYINWVTTNMCGMHTLQNTNIGTVTVTANDLKLYVAGGGSVPASINTSCITGGSATSTLAAAAILFTSQICAINTTLASIPASSYALTWATNFGSTPYYGYTFGFTNSSDTLINQLGKIVSTLGRLKLKLNSSDFVATSDADGLNVALASGVRFACSQLSTCSISALSDVTTSSPATYHTLFWNGSEFVNKELIFTSTGGTVSITRTDNVGNVTINLESSGSSGTATAVNLVAGTLTNAVVAPSLRFPSGSLPKVSKFGKTITIVGSLAVNASGSFAWAHGQSLIFATVPAGYLPLYLPVFNVLILKYATTSGTNSTVVYQGVCYINGSDLTIELNNPASPISLAVGESLEIFIGGNSYAAI